MNEQSTNKNETYTRISVTNIRRSVVSYSVDSNLEDRCDCSVVYADLRLLIDKEQIDDELRDRLLRHINQCPACFESYELDIAVKNLLAKKCYNVSAPKNLRDKIREKLGQHKTLG